MLLKRILNVFSNKIFIVQSYHHNIFIHRYSVYQHKLYKNKMQKSINQKTQKPWCYNAE